MLSETFVALKKGGYRITQMRKAILEIFVSVGKPLSADEILMELSKRKLYPNKTTIYRELETLLSGDFIKEVHLGLGHRMYEITSAGHHHHLVCMKCKRVEDVPMENDVGVFEKKIMKKTSFKISSHSLEFFGCCAKCQ